MQFLKLLWYQTDTVASVYPRLQSAGDKKIKCCIKDVRRKKKFCSGQVLFEGKKWMPWGRKNDKCKNNVITSWRPTTFKLRLYLTATDQQAAFTSASYWSVDQVCLISAMWHILLPEISIALLLFHNLLYNVSFLTNYFRGESFHSNYRNK